MDGDNPGARLVALRPRGQYTCIVCGKTFEARQQAGKYAPRYCSNACGQRASYRQRKGLPVADADQPRRVTPSPAGADPRPPLPPADLTRISVDPAVQAGEPVLRGTRLTISSLVGLWRAGHTVEQIREAYPRATAEDVAAALAWERGERP